MVIFAHVVKDGGTLPVGGLKVAMVGALFCDLDFAVFVAELGVDFFLTLRADAFGLAHINHPTMASTIRARGSSIIDMVTMRSYLRTFCTVDPEMKRLIEE